MKMKSLKQKVWRNNWNGINSFDYPLLDPTSTDLLRDSVWNQIEHPFSIVHRFLLESTDTVDTSNGENPF